MTNGRNDFPAVLTVADVSRITDRVALTYAQDMTSVMDYEDLQTALVIRALIEYLKEHRCEPGFVLDIEESK